MSYLSEAARDHSNPRYATTYGEIRGYYQYKSGAKGYIGAMAQAISGSPTKSGKEYLAARRSIERIEKGQYKGFGPKYAAKVPEVGKTLPPVGYTPKSDTITIKVTAKQQSERKGGGDRPRNFTATFSGPEAYAFVNDPTMNKVLIAMGYPKDVLERIGDDGPYPLTVTGAA